MANAWCCLCFKDYLWVCCPLPLSSPEPQRTCSLRAGACCVWVRTAWLRGKGNMRTLHWLLSDHTLRGGCSCMVVGRTAYNKPPALR